MPQLSPTMGVLFFILAVSCLLIMTINMKQSKFHSFKTTESTNSKFTRFF